MSPRFYLASTPPTDWSERCLEARSLFHGLGWHRVLQQGFGANTLYVWDAAGGCAFALNVFKVGPFRIGYLGFPVGGVIGGSFTRQHLDVLRLLSLPFDLLRIPVSGFGEPLPTRLISHNVPETAIIDLQSWSLANVPKFRRNVRKSKRAGLQSILLQDPSQAGALYSLYRDTIQRHAGALRYTGRYFQALAELSAHEPRLQCWVTMSNQQISGFLVAALEGNTAYYLHGGINDNLREHGGSAILFNSAINWAKQHDIFCFNFMPSPPNQPALVRYKEKLGGVTRLHQTYEVPLAPIRFRMLKAALWGHEKYRRLRAGRP